MNEFDGKKLQVIFTIPDAMRMSEVPAHAEAQLQLRCAEVQCTPTDITRVLVGTVDQMRKAGWPAALLDVLPDDSILCVYEATARAAAEVVFDG